MPSKRGRKTDRNESQKKSDKRQRKPNSNEPNETFIDLFSLPVLEDDEREKVNSGPRNDNETRMNSFRYSQSIPDSLGDDEIDETNQSSSNESETDASSSPTEASSGVSTQREVKYNKPQKTNSTYFEDALDDSKDKPVEVEKSGQDKPEEGRVEEDKTEQVTDDSDNDLIASSVELVGKPMRLDFRNCVNSSDKVLKDRTDMKDALKIAVFSQEASRNFARGYHKKLEEGEDFYQAFLGKEKSEIDTDIIDILKSNVSYGKGVDDHEQALIKLFENKPSPHVISVIEGGRDILVKKFNLGSSRYVLNDFHIEGKNANGTADAKQNIHYYVREDMAGAIKFQTADIDVGSLGQFTVGEVQFETDNGNKYSILTPHIPNKFIGSVTNCEKTNQGFKDYAEKVAKDRTVVGYIGDTNYKMMMQDNSGPSTGGVVGSQFLQPTSSGAKKFTHFMQAVSLGENPEEDSFVMTQPSTLNHVELQRVDSKVATDHPSIQTYVVLDSPIKNRMYPESQKSLEEAETSDVSGQKRSEEVETTDVSKQVTRHIKSTLNTIIESQNGASNEEVRTCDMPTGQPHP